MYAVAVRRLDTDYIDHYQLHRPDPNTSVVETLGTLAELRAEGKIREIGRTAFSAAPLDEVFDVVESADVQPYPRLAKRGDRSANFIDDNKLATVGRLTKFAEEAGHTMLELAFSWLVSNPTVASVIAGATTPAQVAANVAAASWQLDEADRTTVDQAM